MTIDKKQSLHILFAGLSGSWILGPTVLLIQSVMAGDFQSITIRLLMLTAGVLIGFHGAQLTKTDQDVLWEGMEIFLTASYVFTICFSFVGLLLTFSSYWLAKDIKYFCFALALPCLIALVYRQVLVRHKAA